MAEDRKKKGVINYLKSVEDERAELMSVFKRAHIDEDDEEEGDDNKEDNEDDGTDIGNETASTTGENK